MRSVPFLRACTLAAAALALAGCSSVENFLSGDRVDYRSGASKTQPLEVPPDLTQLSRDSRYQPQGGTVSASTFGQPATGGAAQGAPAVVAPQAIGELRVVRDGNERWLVVPMPPEQLWPQLKTFWLERGFTIAFEQPEAGVFETDWAENRAKLPQDGVRRLLGRVLESFYSTGERDKFRVRVERVQGGSEVYIVHRGMEEVYTNARQDQTVWQPRPRDAQLEAEFLSRLMVKLGTKEETARAAVAAAAPAAAPARARIVAGQPGATLQVDESFDRAWRRVGLALDRSGFTVEDRDRAGGLYYVRYVDPKDVGKEEPGFWSRLFGSKDGPGGPARYRIALKGDGDARTTVTVQNAQGAPENGEAGQRIVALLLDDLK